MTASLVRLPGRGQTRRILTAAAAKLFTRHGYAGTSLQMIADEVGITKASVYHHFRTREELLFAVVEPLLTEVRTIVDEAELLRGRHSRAGHLLAGYTRLAVRNRPLFPAVSADPSVGKVLRGRPDVHELVARQMKLLADVDPGPAGRIKASLVLSGIAGAVGPGTEHIEADVLRHQLVESGRRLLGLRGPGHGGSA
ncbi:TetR/AcrR family transcriptional regulator [Cryptosporangium sp. NPDC048952]|uniref:TetR/AcrR family transcriptional regulator n=1 Tax=Cryptosporangium sp. NPDC048952 TaxID=3363961 RepID=UPI003711B9FA